MVIRRKHLNVLVTLFFAVVIAVVFQQIATDMAEQGIASGGPYDNAAAYPRTIALLLGFLIVLKIAVGLVFRTPSTEPDEGIEVASLSKPFLMLVVFAVYLSLLSWIGYHIATPPMLLAVMYIAGVRNPVALIALALGMSLFFAFMFEFFLKIVLPGGVFRLVIPWS
ncbi:tripartite tricarboxylate transporter TctB family protein [Nitratireductor sp. XY-223]|uniref:tripartite tricarboxylate transporter TctB family protein n=1 Tax=Nitratireductor sp. XY-223 TaxID=2561926 RepID=UPI0010AA27B7|nr:tripartite tricarboxylate transporter TctB family protein [Nitratireductor sp. XY-223]